MCCVATCASWCVAGDVAAALEVLAGLRDWRRVQRVAAQAGPLVTVKYTLRCGEHTRTPQLLSSSAVYPEPLAKFPGPTLGLAYATARAAQTNRLLYSKCVCHR